jgi:hypothetical protein
MLVQEPVQMPALGSPPVVVCCHRRASAGAGMAGGNGRGGSGREPLGHSSLSPRRFHGRLGYESVGLVTENLRVHCPPAYPVLVRAGKTPPNIDGFCVRRDRKFVITIDHGLGVDCVINCLLHEWAHALGWTYLLDKAADEFAAGLIGPHEFDDVAHGPEFGIAYATCWRAFVRWVVPALGAA